MPLTTVTLTFTFPLNVSVQVGDTAYYCNTTLVGAFNTSLQSDIIEIGEIISIVPWNGTVSTIVCYIDTTTIPPTSDDFIMFSKDNKANLSSILGYFAKARFRNNSVDKAELFSVAAEIVESSK